MTGKAAQEYVNPVIPKVSVIIVNYDGANFLEKLLLSLSCQTFRDFEVIFVDNFSNDSSLKIAERFAAKSSKIRIVKLSSNHGFCKGNNLGLEYSRGEYITLLNNDTHVSNMWLEELVKVMDSDSSVGICQSKIIDIRHESVTYGNFLGVYGRKHNDVSFKNVDCVFEGAFYASGASLIMRRSLVRSMGYLFDESQFTGDMDLSWRSRLMGFRIVTGLRSICYHYQGHSSRLVLKKEANFGYVVIRDKLHTFLKNYAVHSLFLRIPFLIFIDFLNALYVSIQEQSLVIHSLPKAIFWNMCNLKKTWKDHIEIQAKRIVSDDTIEKAMLPYPAEIYFFKLGLIQRQPVDKNLFSMD